MGAGSGCVRSGCCPTALPRGRCPSMGPGPCSGAGTARSSCLSSSLPAGARCAGRSSCAVSMAAGASDTGAGDAHAGDARAGDARAGDARAGDARASAFAVIRRVFEHGAYTDRAFHTEAAALAPRERSFAMQLAYGTVQRRATLDYVAGRLVRRPLARLEPPVLAGLRLGLFQLLYLGGVAPHAA